MSNYPAPRTIPEGKILLSDYGLYGDDERAHVEKIAEAFSARVRTDVRLIWSSPGFEPAGSCARWTNGFWAVQWDQFGARQGRRYLPTDDGEQQARAFFDKITTEPDPYATA